MKATHFSPVLIVGAGPTGMTAALELANFGIPSLILTASEGLCEGSRAIAFHQSTLATWEKLGVGAAMVEKGVAWSARHTFYGTRKLYSQSFPKPERGGLPRFLNIQQCEVERLLMAQIVQNPLIKVRWKCRVNGLEQDSRGVRLCVETHTGEEHVHGTYVLACDGARSTMRQLLELPFPGETFQDRFLIADIRADLDWPQEPRFFFNHPSHRGPSVLIHPQPGGIWRIDWQLGANADIEAERSSEPMDARIRALIGDTPYTLEWLSDYRFHQRILDQFRHGQVFFAGDSAHLVAPFGARGLNSAVHDVENLCWKIALVLNNGAPDSLLNTYDGERQAAQQLNQAETNATMRFMCPQTLWQRIRRRVVLTLGTWFPSAHKHINSGRMCQPFTYTDSPLNTSDAQPNLAWPDSLALGSKINDQSCVLLTLEGMRSSHLRQLLGNGFVIFHFTHSKSDALGLQAQMAEFDMGIPIQVVPVFQSPPLGAEMHDLAVLDLSGKIARSLGARLGATLLVRPDGHLCARFRQTDAQDLANAIQRAVGRENTPAQLRHGRVDHALAAA
ncbi:MAG: FAD-dependent monooxygenase [Saprospiraceae bacterium]